MNPQQPLSPDYLDQIAPQTLKHSFMLNKTRLIIFVGIIAIILVIILALVIGAINNQRKEPWERLSFRLAATSEIAESSQGKIKNSQLRSTNSTLTISITNAQRDIAAPLEIVGIDTTEPSPAIVTSESSADMLARLEDARLNAKYDSTYAREMSFQLSNLLTLLRQIYSSSSNDINRTFLKTTYDNFEPLQKSLAEFNASNE